MASISAKTAARAQLAPKRVVIVVYPGVTLLDATGPAQVFSSANTELKARGDCAGYELVLASPSGGDVVTDTGITLGTCSLHEASSAPVDTLVVAGGVGVFGLLDEGRLIDWVVARHGEFRRLATTCMGAFVTAEAGLLDGMTVTTHWRHTEELQRRHPSIRVQRDPLFTRDGKMWSAAGVTAGIDLALAMVDEDHGHEIAMQVAQSLVVFLKRPGGQSQFSAVLSAQSTHDNGRFAELQSWIAENLQADLNVEALARRAAMSPRTFARLYKTHVGVTPARHVEMLRVDMAKRLLEREPAPLTTIAKRSGLVDEQRLRRAFLRHAGVSPSEYRAKFGMCVGA